MTYVKINNILITQILQEIFLQVFFAFIDENQHRISISEIFG